MAPSGAAPSPPCAAAAACDGGGGEPDGGADAAGGNAGAVGKGADKRKLTTNDTLLGMNVQERTETIKEGGLGTDTAIAAASGCSMRILTLPANCGSSPLS